MKNVLLTYFVNSYSNSILAGSQTDHEPLTTKGPFYKKAFFCRADTVYWSSPILDFSLILFFSKTYLEYLQCLELK